MLDYNNAETQMEVIPAGTIVVLATKVRPGGAGDGCWLRRSKDGQSEGLDCEFTVVEGPHAKRKLWTLFTLSGVTDGHAEAAKISGAKIRAMLESARGIRPDDKSAAQARRIEGYGDLDGLRFLAKLGVEPARNGFKAKNTLDLIVTPDKPEWHPVPQVAKPAANSAPACTAPAANPLPVHARPTWAR
jgi:hypothetical protein